MTSNITLAIIPFRHDKKEYSTIVQSFEEDLVYHLSKFHGLSILSYFSTSQWSISDEETLRKYQVSHVITGFFRQIENRTVINVQLIEVPQNKVIYDQRVDYKEGEVLNLLDQAVVQITNILQDQLSQSILSKSYQKPTVDLESYELLLMGNAFLKHRTPEDDLKARTYFEEALKKQPKYARAFAGISSSYFNQWSCQLWDRWEISQNGAKKYALKAIENDANDYQSLCILGRVLLFEEDFDQAEFYLRKSLEMNRNDPSTLLEIAFSLMFLGLVDEAIDLYERACRLNPMKEDKYLSVGATLIFEKGDFEKSLVLGKQLEISGTYIDFPVYMAAASYYLGDEQGARQYWEHYLGKFNKHIYFRDKGKTQDALSWQINVNPYKGVTRLSGFYDFIRGQSLNTPEKPNYSSNEQIATLRISGERVMLTYAGKICDLSKTKGLIDIITLLEKPHQDIHCMELMQVKDDGNKGISVIDDTSKKAYQKRIAELQDELQEAESLSDSPQYEKLNEEYDQLVDHLSKSLGLKGDSRKVGSTPEKARAAVTLRIRDSIKKISTQNEALGRHLSNSIKTGLLCSYRPEVNIQWDNTSA